MRLEKLDLVALFVSDPDRVAAMVCARLPFRVLERTDELVLVGRSPELETITLLHGSGPRDRGALLLGLLVESLAEIEESVAEQSVRVDREVDAENSKAIFVCGPDDEELEYIEHKPSFALA